MVANFSKFTKQGYQVLLTKKSTNGDNIAFIVRPTTSSCFQDGFESIVAWGYDENTGSWCQGHYFSSFIDATQYFKTYFE